MNDIRNLVTATLERLGLAGARSLGEQLICASNSRLGIRFAFEGVSAIWMHDAGLVRFVDDAGHLLKVVRHRPAPREVEQVA